MTTFSNALYFKGSYLRYGDSSGSANDSLYIPEYERLPNIIGSFDSTTSGKATYQLIFNNATATGAFQLSETKKSDAPIGNGNYYDAWRFLKFDASKSSSIYDGKHVVPANYTAYIFIYAGGE